MSARRPLDNDEFKMIAALAVGIILVLLLLNWAFG